MRKLATIRKINEIFPIPEADAIVGAVVDGWKVVIKKNEFQINDPIIYCEIDSWIPFEVAPFLCKGKEPRVYCGVKGERLKTVRLRGQISQGLILPFDLVKQNLIEQNSLAADESNLEAILGHDVTALLEIQKYEPIDYDPVKGGAGGRPKSKTFPGFIPKTDQERIQNLKREFAIGKERGLTWEVTEKVDGTSCTIFYVDEENFGVCSRNLQLILDEKKEGEEGEEQQSVGLYWEAAIRNNVHEKIKASGRALAVQGEIITPKVQANLYKLSKNEIRFFVFDVFDIKNGTHLSPIERRTFCAENNLVHAPVLEENYVIPMEKTIDEILLDAEGFTVVNPLVKVQREGLVFKCNEERFSFKAISNKFLLSHQ